MVVLSDVRMPAEGVRISQPQVQAYFDTECAGEGTLCVSESSVTWVNRQSNKGISLPYPSIILHAISTDLSSFPQEHIYVLVDSSKARRRRRRPIPLYTSDEAQNLNVQEEPMDEEEGNDADSESAPSIQIRFVPTDISVLQQIYQEMCNCQELNPHEEDLSDEEIEGDEGVLEMGGDPMASGQWFTAENMPGDIQLSEEGLANLQRMMGGHHQHNDGHEDAGDDEMDEN